MLRRRSLATGTLFLTFVAWYGIGGLTEDFFRIDDTHGLFLTASQSAAAGAVLTAATLLIGGHRPGRRPRPHLGGRHQLLAPRRLTGRLMLAASRQ